MHLNPKIHRQQLFDRFSSQLSLLHQKGLINFELNYEKTYICPICLRQFSEKHLETTHSNFLTLEDAPAASLGGFKVALTCKECNSTCGHQIDWHLTGVIRQIDDSYFYKGSVHHRQIQFEGETVNVELTSLGDGTLKAYHRIKNNNPTRLEKFIHGVKTRNIQIALNIEPVKSKVDPKRVNYALVKANYIITFARFGYIFLLHPSYDSLRSQLLEPQNIHYPWSPFIKDQMTANNIGTYYIQNPGIESILNVFRLRTTYSQTIIAGTLPLPFLTTPQFAQRVDAAKNGDNELMLDTTNYDPEANIFADWTEISKIINWIAARAAANQ